jgi:EF hand
MKRPSRRPSVIVMLAAALAAGACASPATHGGHGGPGGGPPGSPGGPAGPQLGDSMIARPVALLFVSMDTDHDLVTTAEELAAAIPLEFARADADHSGAISGFEMADWDTAVMGYPEALPDRREMDVDLSSTVSRNEFEIALRKEFVTLDKNADGKLSRAELLMPAPERRMGPMGEVGGGRPQGGGGGGGGGGRGRGGRGGGGGPGGPF